MLLFSKEAVLVYEVLVVWGLEILLRLFVYEMDNEMCKSFIVGYMIEIMQLLNFDLVDDSLMEMLYCIVKMYVDEIFFGLDYVNFLKIIFIENKMKVDEMVIVCDIILISICEYYFVIIDGKVMVVYILKDLVIGLLKINCIV